MTPEIRIDGQEAHDLELARLRGKLAEIRGPEHLEQPLCDLGECFEPIAARIGARVQRVLARVRSREVSMSRFDEELRALGEIELIFIVGGAGAGKTYVDHLFEAWIPKRAGIETREITWEKNGIAAGRASTDPDKKILTHPGEMLDDHGLWVAGDFLEGALWDEIVHRRSPSIAIELASSSVIYHSDVNKSPAMSFGKERGLWALYNLIHKRGRFKNLPPDLKIWVNLVGLVGGFLPRNVMTYLRHDINQIDLESPAVLREAAVITDAYGKRPPSTVQELIELRQDGASHEQVLRIELENNKVVTQIKGMPLFRWPNGTEELREESSASLLQTLMSDERVRLPLRASHLNTMFTGLGKPVEGITLSTFVGVNDPRIRDLGIKMEKIKQMGDAKRRDMIEKAEQLDQAKDAA